MSDELSYFSSLESPITRVRVTPAVQSVTPNRSEGDDNNANPASVSEDDSSSNPSLKADKFSLSKEAEQKLSTEDLRLIQKLAQRDREVKAHEAAHLAAAGRYASSAASFTYQRGPNGVNYAIGGEVSLDTSTPSDPQQALAKAQQIRAAALAPAQPSGQDRAVASQASQAASQARAEITNERIEEAAERVESTKEGGGEETTQQSSEGEVAAGSETGSTPQTQNGIQEYQQNDAAPNGPDAEERDLSLSLEA